MSSYSSRTNVHLSRHNGAQWVAKVKNYGYSGWEGCTQLVYNRPCTNTNEARGARSYTLTWARSYINTYYLPANTAVSRIKVTWLHELGHGLGLEHHHSNAYTVMYDQTWVAYNNGVRDLASDDIAGINTIYR